MDYAPAMGDDTQQEQWLAWERELTAAIAGLKAAGGHERVVHMLEHQVTVAMHNAYCHQQIDFPRSGVPTA
jgi:hypothetical protein